MSKIMSVVALPYNAVSDERNYTNDGVLSREEEKQIAKIVNKAINIPFMSEKREYKVFLAGIRLIDKALTLYLPEELLECIHDIQAGVSHEEVAVLEKRITPIINQMINIPLIPEFLEARLISMVLGIILNALRQGAKVLS